MRVHNLGSINIDHFLQVPNLPSAGETVLAAHHQQQPGGKGLNMSVALSRAGIAVQHYGAVGPDGQWLLDFLASEGVGIEGVAIQTTPTGSAMVCVDRSGENLIVVNSGANHQVGGQQGIDEHCQPGDWVLVQNETTGQSEFIDAARVQGARVAYAAAPFDVESAISLLPRVDVLFVNEIEARQLSQAIGRPIQEAGPQWIVVTLGSRGAEVFHHEHRYAVEAQAVDVVDTTAAGDTFTGYFLAGLARQQPLEQILQLASKASGYCVAHRGAAQSIPRLADLD